MRRILAVAVALALAGCDGSDEAEKTGGQVLMTAIAPAVTADTARTPVATPAATSTTATATATATAIATAAPTRPPQPTPMATSTPTPPAALPPTSTPTTVPFNKLKFYETMPVPSDAEIISVVEGIDIGFRTRMSEPAIIALYTNWIAPQGWTKASELPYLQPNERWTKGGYEFVVYITPKGAEGVAVINIQVRPQSAP